MRRGRISEQMGRSEQAIQHYRQAWRHSAELVDAVVWGTRLLLEAQKYSDALNWTTDASNRHPGRDDVKILHGEVLFRLGRDDDAHTVWQEVLLARPEWHRPYVLIVDALTRADSAEQALRYARRGERDTPQKALFARRTAELALAQDDFPSAAEALVRYVSHDPERTDDAIVLLDRANPSRVDSDSLSKTFTAALKTRPQQPGLHRLAAQSLVAAGHPLAAVEQMAVASRMEKDQGQRLYDFAATLKAQDELASSAEALNRLALEFPRSPLVPAARFAQAQALESAGLFELAAEPYRQIISHGRSQYADRAKLSLAAIILETGGDIAEADRLYRQLTARGGRKALAWEGTFGQGMCAVWRSDFEVARRHFGGLAANTGSQKWQAAQLELVRIGFYQGDAKSTNEAMEPLTTDHPHLAQTNDALSLRLLLAEAEYDTGAWRYAGRVAHHLRIGQYDSVLSMASGLSNSRPLNDWILLQGAKAAVKTGDKTLAVNYWEQVTSEFSDGTYADDALWELGRFQETYAGSATAIETYDRLLEKYPESPLAAKSRAAIRQLRSQTNST